MLRKTLIGFVVGVILSFSFAAAAEDLGLTGTVTPPQPAGGGQTLAVTISPNPVDLTSTAGELVVKDVQFQNVGNVKAAVSLASPTDVSFSGLAPFGSTWPTGEPYTGVPFDPSDPALADRCEVYFVWEPTGWPGNAADFYLHHDGTQVKALHFMRDFSGQMFTLDPGAHHDTQVRFQSSSHLASPVSVNGSIAFTITAAE